MTSSSSNRSLSNFHRPLSLSEGDTFDDTRITVSSELLAEAPAPASDLIPVGIVRVFACTRIHGRASNGNEEEEGPRLAQQLALDLGPVSCRRWPPALLTRTRSPRGTLSRAADPAAVARAAPSAARQELLPEPDVEDPRDGDGREGQEPGRPSAEEISRQAQLLAEVRGVCLVLSFSAAKLIVQGS